MSNGEIKLFLPHCPDFLPRLVALLHSTRLSLMKRRTRGPLWLSVQEIGVKPHFGLSRLPCLPYSFVISTRAQGCRDLLFLREIFGSTRLFAKDGFRKSPNGIVVRHPKGRAPDDQYPAALPKVWRLSWPPWISPVLGSTAMHSPSLQVRSPTWRRNPSPRGPAES